jgi:hypothetical protein
LCGFGGVLSIRRRICLAYGKPTVGIRFGPRTPFQDQAVLETLPQLAQLTSEAVEAFERFCFGNVPDPNALKKAEN